MLLNRVLLLQRIDGRVSRCFTPAAGGDTEATLCTWPIVLLARYFARSLARLPIPLAALEEKLRRERSRQTSVGVTTYSVVPGDRGVIFVQDGSLLWLQRDAPAPVVAVDRAATGAPGPVLDATPSPDGLSIAWVQGAELYCAHLSEHAIPVQVRLQGRQFRARAVASTLLPPPPQTLPSSPPELVGSTV